MGEMTEKVLRKYLRANPTSTLFAKYADLLLQQDKVHEAYVIAIHGVQSHPRFATGWLILGKAALERGEAPFAKQCWMNALAADKMCLQAAELLLTTGGLDLKMKEAHIAATAILNIDSDHLVARTTMKLIAEQQRGTSRKPGTSGANPAEPSGAQGGESRGTGPGESSSPGESNPLSDFELYGTDKQHISDLLRTIERMRKVRTGSKREETNGQGTGASRTQEQTSGRAEGPGDGQKQHRRGQSGRAPDSQEADEYAENLSDQEDITIPARMATLTFVEVLKAQGLYENALAVLKMIPRTTANAERIDRIRDELHSLLETQ